MRQAIRFCHHSSRTQLVPTASWSLSELNIGNGKGDAVVTKKDVNYLCTLSCLTLRDSMNHQEIIDDVNVILKCAQSIQSLELRYPRDRSNVYHKNDNVPHMYLEQLRDDHHEKCDPASILSLPNLKMNDFFVVPMAQ